MTRRMVQRGAFLLMAAALVLGISRIPAPAPAPEPSAPDDVVYVYNGYAAKTDAAFDTDSLDRAAYRFRHLYDLYFTGRTIFLAVVPDKAQFTVPPEGYTPAGAAETADYLCGALDFLTPVDITAGLTLADYYRTDPHWRQEQLGNAAGTVAAAMGKKLTMDYETRLATEDFLGVYAGQSALPVKGEPLYYLWNDSFDALEIQDRERNREIGVYDLSALDGRDPYELFLSGSLSLITVKNPNASSDDRLILFRDSFGSSIAPYFFESYAEVTLVDIRYLSVERLGAFLDFENSDVLFLYSTLVLNNSETLK